MSQGILETIAANQTRIITLLEGLQLNALASSEAGETTTTKTTAKKNTKAKAEEKVKPTHTKDEVVAAVVAVKDAFGAPAAKAITGQFGLAKIAEAKEDQFDAIFDACQEKLAEADNDEGEEEV